MFRRLPIRHLSILCFPAALALACAALAAPAAAAQVAADPSAPIPLAIPWGDWLVAALQPVSAVLVPLAAAAVTAGVARVAPWAASVLTRPRAEAARTRRTVSLALDGLAIAPGDCVAMAGEDGGWRVVDSKVEGYAVTLSLTPLVTAIPRGAASSGHVVAAPAIVVGATLTEAQFDRLKQELEDSFQGARNAGRPLLLEGGLDWKPLSLTPAELDFVAAKGVAAREIALAFGVPPLLLGLPGDNTHANYAEANRALYRQTLIPLAARTAQALAGWLEPAFGLVDLEPDLDRIEALAAERESLWRRVQAADFLSVAEKREAVGYPPAMPRAPGTP